MYEAPVLTAEGEKAKGKARSLPDSVFDGTIHEAVMWQAAKAYLANQRKGNASTRNRSRVAGGARKPWRQKGTGRARQGTIRAPQWRGGGVVFGPTNERNHRQELPRKVRSLARRSALNARADAGQVFVFESLALEAPKTKRVIALLEGAGAEGNVLILTHGHAPTLHRSARNIPQVRVVVFGQESAYDVLWSDAVLIESSALEAVAEAADAARPAAAARSAAAKPAVGTEPESDAKPGAEGEPEAKAKPEAKPKLTTKAKPRAEAKSKSKAKPKASAKAKATPRAEAKSKPKASAKAKTKAKADADDAAREEKDDG
ncbi:MAG TPA: 50S ribosomal protein L4 [Longimicrobiales bacterium]|nr:50S ribosomal protein L4 [Longimicrobiales bacterium]